MTNNEELEQDYYRIQKTIAKKISFNGVGIHSGKTTKITLFPAAENHGVVFEKKAGRSTFRIPAHYDFVVSTAFATTIGIKDSSESYIATVEHLLSACYGLGITNLLIVIEGDEIPILDGSSEPFIQKILEAGLAWQYATAPTIKILKPIKIYENEAICELLPRDNLRLTTTIDFTHPLIKQQIFALEVSPDSFSKEVAGARTFGFLKDVETLKKKNLALGASLQNVLGFSEDAILNPEGPRFENECVRHKLLDALGDLSLSGAWIQGEMVSFRGGHAMHLNLLRALKSHPESWKWIPVETLSPISADNVISFNSHFNL